MQNSVSEVSDFFYNTVAFNAFGNAISYILINNDAWEKFVYSVLWTEIISSEMCIDVCLVV